MSESSNHQHIRKRSWGRFYVAPVLLDHRSYKWLMVTVIVMGLGSFFGGYISGYEKAEDVFMSEMGSMDLILPEVDISDLALVEAQVPEIEEPGASIDVDSVDSDNVENVTAKNAVVSEPDQPIIETQAVAARSADTMPATTQQVLNTKAVEQDSMEPPATLGVGGPAAEVTENQDIIEDATEETARYSIQVGMYSNFDNATSRVDELLNKQLNAYVNDYKNKQNETRYNVRFGYFASFASAKQALDVFEQSYAGNGYIARVSR